VVWTCGRECWLTVNRLEEKKNVIAMDRYFDIFYYSPSIGLAVICFYSKTRFWPSYYQISTDLDNNLHTPIVVRNTLVGRLRPWLARGAAPGQTRTKSALFRVLGYPSTVLHTAYKKQFYPKPMVPMESRDSERMPCASPESLWPGIWQI